MAACSHCDTVDERRLYARMAAGRHLCHGCWVKLGRPSPGVEDMEAVHQAELAALEAMTRRGGTDRNLVRNGRS